ncbi:Jip5p PWA37_004491 [Arxiozyma heterogenica]|uniref:WD repeat-containing protein JIP5 n=1 Tax=Arxiozyma heterogenica TaxID=278026 RepID=A0AAN7WSI3_9SACH|nr:hypothetical protein RI543_000779 [Kazachstania heterogenica]
MGKKNSKTKTLEESKITPLLQWNSTPDSSFFQFVAHPTKPILYFGLSSGHIFSYKYDLNHLSPASKNPSSSPHGYPEVNIGETIPGLQILWKTKRHKSSLHGLTINSNGRYLFSVGNDNIIKKADSLTGQVIKKGKLPEDWQPSTKITVTDDVLILGNEIGDVLVLDPTSLHLKNRINKIHFGDPINDIFQFVNRSKYKFISLGQTTLAYWDTHNKDKEKIMLSDDQEDEILCGCFVDNEESNLKGETLVCGMGEGILTVWKPKINDLEDQMSRIKVCPKESIDCIISTLQDDNCVWCGCSNGKLYKVNIKSNRIIEIRNHDSDCMDEVSMIDLDHEYRVISGGMDSIKLWPEVTDTEKEEEEGEEESGSDIDSFSDSSDSSIDDNSDIDDSDTDNGSSNEEETLVGLSKEELLAELDKDLKNVSDSEELEKNEDINLNNDNISSKRRRKDKTKETKNKRQKKSQYPKKNNQGNNNHGILKFEGL